MIVPKIDLKFQLGIGIDIDDTCNLIGLTFYCLFSALSEKVAIDFYEVRMK